MPVIRAKRPLNGGAVQAANRTFYDSHPEMVKGGVPQPIDPCDPAQAPMRQEWVNAYQRNGGQVERGSNALACQEVKKKLPEEHSPQEVCSPTLPCGKKAPHRPPPPPKPPATLRNPTCELVNMTATCSHGRHPGPENILMVVPDSMAGGDSVSATLSMKGGCGNHAAWSVSGLISKSGKGTKFDVSAHAVVPTMGGVATLRYISPQVYRLSGSSCSGGQTAEVRAYPASTQQIKINLNNPKEVIHALIKHLPINAEEKFGEWEKKWFQGEIDYQGAWHEDKKSWQAYYEQSCNGGFDPLFGLSYKGQVYPPSLVPASLTKYLEAGVFCEFKVGAKCQVNFKFAYWPSEGNTVYAAQAASGSGTLEGALSIELKLVHPDVIEATVKGETAGGITVEASKQSGESPEVELKLKWEGITVSFAIKALGGIVTRNYTCQIVQKQELPVHTWTLKAAQEGKSE